MPYSVKSVASAIALTVLIVLCLSEILDPLFAMLSGILLALTLPLLLGLGLWVNCNWITRIYSFLLVSFRIVRLEVFLKLLSTK